MLVNKKKYVLKVLNKFGQRQDAICTDIEQGILNKRAYLENSSSKLTQELRAEADKYEECLQSLQDKIYACNTVTDTIKPNRFEPYARMKYGLQTKADLIIMGFGYATIVLTLNILYKYV